MTSPTGLFAVAPWLLLLYLALAILAPALCRRLGRGALIVLALLPAATTVWAAAMLPSVMNGGALTSSTRWVPALDLAIDLRMDALAMALTLIIAFIGMLVLLYSARYFPADDDGLSKYSGSLVAFAGAMLGLVWANNLILLVVCWELTGILSYLLIAHRAGKKSSRTAASQALMVTTAGGLVMLIGAVMLGTLAGTFTISEILAAPPSGPLVTVSVLLLIVGGISKSAIVPFQFWLPGAMAAPTPASAYLHAATMVKAGIYLFLRLAPAFATLPVWQPVLIALGGGTMLFGAVLALRQRDLKLLLAYGTVSQLGLMTLVIGTGNPDALLGGLAMLIAHATFKAPLFFTVGIIDTTTGTRDLTKLSGLGRRMPLLATLAVLSALSMAGIPPMLGFAAKEADYAGLLEGGTGGYVAVVVMALGSAITTAYSARFIWGAFAAKKDVPAADPAPTSAFMVGPTMAMVAIGLVLGIAPGLLEPLLQSYAQTAGPTHPGAMALWHGWSIPLALSAAGWLIGAAVFLGQRAWERRRDLIARPGAEPGIAYRVGIKGVDVVADGVTNATQRGSLPVSLGAILLVLVLFPGTMLLTSGVGPKDVEVIGQPGTLVICVVILAIAAATLRARRALPAVMMVGGIGYAMAVLFILRGAPDLALTQILVETITLVAALLVLTRLPDDLLFAKHRGNAFRAIIAVAAGALMTGLALIIPGTRVATPVSADLAGPAVEFGGGYNIVNVILVDVRAWDTFGELTVLIAAATGVASMIFLVRRTGRTPRRPTQESSTSRPHEPSPWLATNWMPRRSLLLEVVTRMIFHVIVVFSVYVLFVGHDAPGGGFAAGLIVGLALALRYIAGGAYELGEAAPWDPGILMGTGLFISAATAIYGVIAGGAALQSTILKATVPLLGDLKFVTSSIFDVGVYLIVIGLVLDVLRAMGAELDRQGMLERSERTSSTRDRQGAR
ncbi:Na+/H+ antiporter subunit A [Nakamurella multipartita]|uniref:NADH/Ubiquinone/plastoquinone (Complex I) n=1 Tax=Nakamurella multipartita (strain ATCC 700099 / DSM 44233 / CIP 104796 / JCM 9543 / NBRC 105858 / Y-104) TaxID=479431 RepID=C8XH11_NAKMY|nr:Na+/H+ antiporter subunit A [Nakamurella multipartita]ACV80242.1 NADH/Ubiquinone/plastoquinone (complex I) [Nakamurella multipartita DSM 44233]